MAMHVEVVTPKKAEFTGEAEEVILPTMKGEITILAGHAPLISVLKPGTCRIRKKGEETKFQITGGVVEVENDKVNILLKEFRV